MKVVNENYIKDRADLRTFRQWRITIEFLFQQRQTLCLFEELEKLDTVIMRLVPVGGVGNDNIRP